MWRLYIDVILSWILSLGCVALGIFYLVRNNDWDWVAVIIFMILAILNGYYGIEGVRDIVRKKVELKDDKAS
jgi:hypothetical protein